MSSSEKFIIGHRIVQLNSVDSTNNYAATLFKQGKLSHGSVILADEQYSGRGQRGAKWESNPGLNALLTVVLEPANLSVSSQFLLTKVVSLSVSGALNRLGIAAHIKWPNDIYCNDKKIAGILIENTSSSGLIRNSCVGIGINVNQTQFDVPYATSVKGETGQFHKVMDLLFVLISELNFWYDKLLENDLKTLDEEYLNRLYKFNEKGTFEDVNGIFEGVIAGVEVSGKLLIERDGFLKHYDLKEISFVRNSL
ncbi:MAG: biotin--[acetyl-CoA-carboxylase] ligase [Cryomorphaceae bacterium]|jgi:BirA family biotin operon repressor/biotin-[acetyl-CoA-carboxylase] ligase|nr:biotin--[acetyl-CoA-carboxylase] ligase [Cryomorphaceae bacterium]